MTGKKPHFNLIFQQNNLSSNELQYNYNLITSLIVRFIFYEVMRFIFPSNSLLLREPPLTPPKEGNFPPSGELKGGCENEVYKTRH